MLPQHRLVQVERRQQVESTTQIQSVELLLLIVLRQLPLLHQQLNLVLPEVDPLQELPPLTLVFLVALQLPTVSNPELLLELLLVSLPVLPLAPQHRISEVA